MPKIGAGLRTRAGVLGASALAAATLTVSGFAVASSATSTPTKASQIPNLSLVKNQIKAYYGDTGSGQPSATSPFAAEVAGVETQIVRYLPSGLLHEHGKPVILFDVDDTALETYPYEAAHDFGYDPVTNNAFIQNVGMKAVFGMPAVAHKAVAKGYTVFFLTGRPEAQRAATLRDLRAAGYPQVTSAHLFMRNRTMPPAYLPCEPTCTTIQYKSWTRKYINSHGWNIRIDIGDQRSDLQGGYTGKQFKVPNPMYYLP